VYDLRTHGRWWLFIHVETCSRKQKIKLKTKWLCWLYFVRKRHAPLQTRNLNGVHEIWYLSIIWKSVEKISFIKIRQEQRVLYMKTCVRWYLAGFFLEWEMFQKKVAEKIKTPFLYKPSPPPAESFISQGPTHTMRHVSVPWTFRQTWRSVVQPDGQQTTTERITRWIPKAVNTLWEYVTFIANLHQQWSRERASILRYTCNARLAITETVCLLRGTSWIFTYVSGKS
jgi:hypothetical protein